MLGRRRTTDQYAADREVVVEHGASLAKGPALIAGSILVVFGLAALLKNNDFPSFSAQFPNGTAHGTNFLGIEVNGWTAFFSITAGALLLFGAAQHHLAKMMSLIVGLALLACAVIALIDGDDVLGLAATNAWTKAAFAISGAVILFNALSPRRTRTREVMAPAATTAVPATAAPAATTTAAPAAVATGEPVATRRRRTLFGRPGPRTVDEPVADGPRTTRAPAYADEPATTVAPTRGGVAADEPATTVAPTRRAVRTDDPERPV
jgi:hypothetical protein